MSPRARMRACPTESLPRSSRLPDLATCLPRCVPPFPASDSAVPEHVVRRPSLLDRSSAARWRVRRYVMERWLGRDCWAGSAMPSATASSSSWQKRATARPPCSRTSARRDVVRCLWYKLETSDRDWVTFINYLIAAGRQAVPGFAPSTASMLREMAAMNPSRDVVVGSLMELSALADVPTMLILDDFQLVRRQRGREGDPGQVVRTRPGRADLPDLVAQATRHAPWTADGPRQGHTAHDERLRSRSMRRKSSSHPRIDTPWNRPAARGGCAH